MTPSEGDQRNISGQQAGLSPAALLLAAADQLETEVYNGNSADPEYDEAVAAWLRAQAAYPWPSDFAREHAALAVARAVLKEAEN